MSSLPEPLGGRGPVVVAARCASCQAPLAADQLFCLSCGTRRRDARIPFRDVLATEAAPMVHAGGGNLGAVPVQAVGAVPGQPPSGPAAAYTPFLATLACLLIALAIGVWIGRGQDAPVVQSAAPIVGTPAAAAAAPAASTPADAAAADASGDAAASDDAASDDDASSSSSDATAAEEAQAEKDAAAAPKADTKNLESLSPEDYQKKASKLPSEVGTAGKALPKDNKPAGGGSAVEEFN